MNGYSTATNPVKATRTTFRIIESLRELDGAGVTELADRCDIAKSSVHNYLSTLCEDGYVIKDGSRYHLGLRFLDLGAFARQRYPLYRTAKSEVRHLAEETGELANVMIEEHGMGVYIYRETGRKAVNVDAQIGNRVHLHNTALGKAILAHTPPETVDRIIEHHGLARTTERTITDRDELLARLEAVRERGVAFDDEERVDGLRCVAAPITNTEDYAEGAISVSGPASRFRGARFREEIPQLLGDAANVIELNTTYAE